jgi:DNA-binding NarL/FixJ family response regulator
VNRPDPIRLVEAAYTWEPDEARWLEHILRAAAPYDVGGGVIGYTVEVGDRVAVGAARSAIGAARSTASAADDCTSTPQHAIQQVIESLPAALAPDVLAPTEFVGNIHYRLSRLARSSRAAHAAVMRRSKARLPPLWGLVSGDPRLRTLVLCFVRADGRAGADDDRYPHRDARALGLVGAHLAAALRLRTLVCPSADDAATEAVLTARGQLLHASPAASSAASRAALVEAVHASQRARGRMRRSAPDEALELWSALVGGRWTILDVTERDGKRLLLARRNPLGGPPLLDLTPDERDVTWLAAQGHSYKYIAYELGVALSTVADRLRHAMRKLRLRSRRDLLRKLGTARRAPQK